MTVTGLPLFPLPSVVLFPGVLLPLHVFEPRYRELVADVLRSDRRIGMVLLRSGWERDYDGRPPIHVVGCSGVIVHDVRLEDGRYNIVLRGLERFRIVEEDHNRPYRRAVIEPLPEGPLNEAGRRMVHELRSNLETRLGVQNEREAQESGSAAARFAAMGDEAVIHHLAQYLDLNPIEKQALLERDSLRVRAEALVDLLEMKKLEAAKPGATGVSH